MIIFKTALKRIVSQPINWLMILLFPVAFSLIISITGDDSDDNTWMSGAAFPLGVVDQDGTALSQTLVSQLKMRFAIQEIYEEDVTAALTAQDVAWALVIREGFAAHVLEGTAPALDGYSLAITDATVIANQTTQSITRALMILGTDSPEMLTLWGEASQVEISVVGESGNWGQVLQFLGMYGFVAMFAALFVVRTLLDDKLKGMPMRLGVLPVSPRRLLTESTLAAFLATMASAVGLMVAVYIRIGEIPNPGHLFLLLCLFNLFSVALVRAVVSGVKNMSSVSVIVTMFANITSMLGGLFWPLEFVPTFMQRLAWFSPGYWLSRGMRNIQIISFEGFVLPVLFLLAFTVVTLLLGGWMRIQEVEE
ncbi:MAG: ABC transporter permease [Defluviitaleaceae bacterium]|nr:ABC transporter permease [Defluviitaleaceae bacterium]